MKVKHISLDVWNTLIHANPEFAAARTRMLAKVFVESEDFVRYQYSICKGLADEIAIDLGLAHGTPAMIAMLVERICKHGMNTLLLEQGGYYRAVITQELELLFKKHPPIVKFEAALALSTAHRYGITLSIGSNSNFISGRMMEPWLRKQFDVPFEFAVFSDQLGFAKPSYWFFQEIYDLARKNTRVKHPGEIAHIGDDKDYDGGGLKLGFTTFVVSPSQFRNTVEELIVAGE